MNVAIFNWFESIGISVDTQHWLYWVITLSSIFVLIYLVHLIFSKLFIPGIKKIALKTRFSWDDILLSNQLLSDISRLIPPILLAILLPIESNNPNASKYLYKISLPILCPNCINAGLHEFARASLKLCEPCGL